MVTIAPNITKDLTSFSFSSPSAVGIISGTNIAVTVPFGTDVTALVANFTTNGTSVTVGATPQVSGVTANNFTSPVVYTVTGLDSSTKDYTVTVTVALNPAKDITAYSFASPAAVGVITGNAIADIRSWNECVPSCAFLPPPALPSKSGPRFKSAA